MQWKPDEDGVLALPSGRLVRGRRWSQTGGPPPERGLYALWRDPEPEWAYQWLRWPDFGIPLSRGVAWAAIEQAWRATGVERVEVACGGGRGRTGTILAAMAMLEGLEADEAIAWVRAHHDRRAVETLWQRRWLHRGRPGGGEGLRRSPMRSPSGRGWSHAPAHRFRCRKARHPRRGDRCHAGGGGRRLAGWARGAPRASVGLEGRRLAFTCGRVPGDWFGYRSYAAPGSGSDDQVVVVQDERTGRVRAMAVGRALGPRRVGGIGAVALETMAPQDPGSIAVVGAGTQAWHQLWALPEDFRHLPIRVASRSATSRDDFVERARRELGLDARAADDPVQAARDAGIVIIATSSATPVLSASAVRPGAFVSTLGPKQVGRAEFGPDLVREAALVVSDSPAQVGAYQPPHVLAGTPEASCIHHLGALVEQGVDLPADATRLFLSVGLAGTEAWLLDVLAGMPPAPG